MLAGLGESGEWIALWGDRNWEMERKYVVRALGLAVMGCALVGAVRAGWADIVIETVPVGDVGNALDTVDGDTLTPGVQQFGRVDYPYNIGKYEVTAGQYMAFLNAVATTGNYDLYNTNMAKTTNGSGIMRSGSIGGFAYSVDTAFVNRPVNYVSFWDACRFANWLNNGQGGPETTDYGAYTLTSAGISANTITRDAGATWAVTSEDEWYKAAYYRGGSTDAGYWLYPTCNNTAPGQDMADVSGNNANYHVGSSTYPIDGTHYSTVAGEFRNSESPYNTFDQGGNISEWNETIRYDSFRGLRGGSFINTADIYLRSSHGDNTFANNEDLYIGFRVVQLVPEPASLGVLGVAVVGMLVRRRGFGKQALAL
jgi:formylglycine-generating enzyme